MATRNPFPDAFAAAAARARRPARADHRRRGLHAALHRPAVLPLGRLQHGLRDGARDPAVPVPHLRAADGVAVGANLVIAYRLRPPFRPLSLEQQNLERYRRQHRAVPPAAAARRSRRCSACSPACRPPGAGGPGCCGATRQHFGIKDPQFGKDISYFTFTYPFQRFVLGFLFAIVLVSLLVAAFTHYLYGGIRLQTQGERVIAGRQGAPVGAARPVRAAQGGRVLAGPLRAGVLATRPGHRARPTPMCTRCCRRRRS